MCVFVFLFFCFFVVVVLFFVFCLFVFFFGGGVFVCFLEKGYRLAYVVKNTK